MTKDNLLIKCKQAGIDVYDKMTNEEIEEALALYDFRFREAVHPYEKMMIMRGSPMLAESILKIPEHNREYVLSTWSITEKVDGVRALMILNKELSPIFFTRGKNVDTLRPLCYRLKQFARLRTDSDTILDGELVYCGDLKELETHYNLSTRLDCRTAAVAILRRSELEPDITDRFPLTYVVFDAPSDYGVHRDRIKLMDEIVDELNDPHIVPVRRPSAGETNQDFLKQLLAEKKEGAILKNPTSLYSWGKSRAHCDWIKVKALDGGGSDVGGGIEIDGVITGFVKSTTYGNIVAAAIISDEDGVEIGRIAGFSLQEKFNMFLNPDKYIGRKLTAIANGTTKANNKKSHMRFARWRDDVEK